MELNFIVRRQYGRIRYFAASASAQALLDLAGRRCLNPIQVARLQAAGFVVRFQEENTKEVSNETGK